VHLRAGRAAGVGPPGRPTRGGSARSLRRRGGAQSCLALGARMQERGGGAPRQLPAAAGLDRRGRELREAGIYTYDRWHASTPS
jgi:hypothetical protein